MADPKVAKPARMLRVALVISLALNLLIVGIVVGAAASGKFANGPPRAFDLGFGPVGRALDRDERRAIGTAMRRDADLRAMNPRAHVAQMVDVLRQVPFDPDALTAVMQTRQAQMSQIQSKAQANLVAQITAMSPERRQIFADRLAQELQRPRNDRKSSGG
ncbi:periplasmic heavy metal sensor [Yoonia sp. SS1-5]|uniref:Periplasmic heavy metal sensor n=1 Tax=Yoonia rhodophyticola TaxID=3137370 RepID=A0AAN0M971_9RHOB